MGFDYEDSYYDSEDYGGKEEQEPEIFDVEGKFYKGVPYREDDGFGNLVTGFDLYDENNSYIDSIQVDTLAELKDYIELHGL